MTDLDLDSKSDLITSLIGAAWTQVSLVHLSERLGSIGSVFEALISGWVGFISCFIWYGVFGILLFMWLVSG